MKLSPDPRDVGPVTIGRCQGRLVSGGESEGLRAHITHLLRDRRTIVLHLGDVAFVDSSGLGTMVRARTGTRQARGDMKLCNVPEHVRKVLQLSHLTNLFDSHESEDDAVAAFYRTPARSEEPVPAERSVLCIDRNPDVGTYTGSVAARRNDVHTSSNLRDGLTLMRVTRLDVLLVGPEVTAAPATEKTFRDACVHVPAVELGSAFSPLEAGEATSRLLERIAACLQSGAGAN